MRQSSRLLQGNRSGAGRSNDPQPTIAGSLPPHTPRHPKTGAALDDLVRSLEHEWRLGLKVRDTLWSPHKVDEKSTAEKVYGQIKRLFFSARPALEEALESFKEIANGLPPDERLKTLHGILKSKTQSPISRAGTPLNEPPNSLKSVQMCKCTLLRTLLYIMGWRSSSRPTFPLPALRLPLDASRQSPDSALPVLFSQHDESSHKSQNHDI
jgi:hypothetical protein